MRLITTTLMCTTLLAISFSALSEYSQSISTPLQGTATEAPYDSTTSHKSPIYSDTYYHHTLQLGSIKWTLNAPAQHAKNTDVTALLSRLCAVTIDSSPSGVYVRGFNRSETAFSYVAYGGFAGTLYSPDDIIAVTANFSGSPDAPRRMSLPELYYQNVQVKPICKTIPVELWTKMMDSFTSYSGHTGRKQYELVAHISLIRALLDSRDNIIPWTKTHSNVFQVKMLLPDMPSQTGISLVEPKVINCAAMTQKLSRCPQIVVRTKGGASSLLLSRKLDHNVMTVGGQNISQSPVEINASSTSGTGTTRKSVYYIDPYYKTDSSGTFSEAIYISMKYQ
ncbi:hypothetical protein [Citrobacter portucalensis]|uniref:hypothetical protein n=1 Tax=Citrobacter portucalensis TaxID=1639133 RepID=UPI00288C5EC8|nr:hypothetical protein [Citrobacter portucalensis]WNI88053.1 hypothetical protein RIK60_09935 [Citrobacter portucalensis]